MPTKNNKTATNRVKTTRKRKNPSGIGIHSVMGDDMVDDMRYRSILSLKTPISTVPTSKDYRQLLKIIPKELVLSLFGFGDVNADMFQGSFINIKCLPNDDLAHIVYLVTNPLTSPVNPVIQVFKIGNVNKYVHIFLDYIIGMYGVNHLRRYFPIFTRTTGLWKLPPRQHRKLITNCIEGDMVSISGITQVTNPIKEVCRETKYFGITSDYIPQFITVSTMITSGLTDELVFVFFQIYYTLYCCKDMFIHGDLHVYNAGVGPMDGDNCIEYVYHVPTVAGRTRIIKFKSKYVVKMIDYGSGGYLQGYTPEGKYIDSARMKGEIKKYMSHCISGFSIHRTEMTIPHPFLYSSTDTMLLIQASRLLITNNMFDKTPGLIHLVNMIPEDKLNPEFNLYRNPPEPSTYPKSISNTSDVYFAILDSLTTYCPSSNTIPLDYINDKYADHNVIATVEVVGLGTDWKYTTDGITIGHDGVIL